MRLERRQAAAAAVAAAAAAAAAAGRIVQVAGLLTHSSNDLVSLCLRAGALERSARRTDGGALVGRARGEQALYN